MDGPCLAWELGPGTGDGSAPALARVAGRPGGMSLSLLLLGASLLL